ncbi:ABC transporter permease [Paenibacillus beijingensis]|uniref:Membrane protein n=1 Tax=Paenibacillus beijingensis TaxID=1126833 RepID=A0A0D5NK90_9BACL|nr:ABC transporter permease [Paenibacillus beijingensis]AJY75764.1 membrane protein [Paenibacillus beijingensis]
MVAMIRSEWLKLRKTVIWMLAAVSPILAAVIGVLDVDRTQDSSAWVYALSMMSVLHAMLFLPLLTGVYAALVCRYEHIGGGWKMMLALPVTRSQVFLVKFGFVVLLLAVTQIIFLAALLLIGLALGFAFPIPWAELLRSVAGGLLACLPLAALQLGVSTAWSSFGAPLAVNVIFTLPNLLIVNSEDYAPYYPWAQPMLAMVPGGPDSYGAFNVSAESLFGIILGGFVLFIVSGLLYFSKKAI